MIPKQFFIYSLGKKQSILLCSELPFKLLEIYFHFFAKQEETTSIQYSEFHLEQKKKR